MAIDLQNEQVLSLTDASKALPKIDGKRLHVSTLWRWCRKGIRGIQLDYVRLGHRVCTSVEALSRFTQQLAESDGQHKPAQSSTSQQPKSRTDCQRRHDNRCVLRQPRFRQSQWVRRRIRLNHLDEANHVDAGRTLSIDHAHGHP